MTNRILVKRSGNAAAIPEAADLEFGELALNYTDGNLFFKTAANTVSLLASTQIANISGNATVGNLISTGSVTATGNVTAAYCIGDGSLLTGIAGGGGSFGVTALDFTGDGSTTAFAITEGYTANTVMVFENGVAQAPVTDYTVSGNVLTFTNAPGSGVFIQARLFSGGNGGGSGGNVTVSADPPIIANSGDIWIDSDTAIQYLYFDDGNSSQWAEMQALVSISSGASGNVDLSAVAQSIVPAANVTYDLGTANLRWRDLYLSGNTIDLGGAKIKSDATEGTIALIPTVITGNTKAVVIGQRGISTVSANEQGEISAEAIAEAANTANTVTGNLISERVLSDSYFFGNGDPFLSAAALKIVRRSQQPLPIRMASGAKIEIMGRSGNVFVDITV